MIEGITFFFSGHQWCKLKCYFKVDVPLPKHNSYQNNEGM